MLRSEPEEVAKFLAKTSGLEKAVIGEYLGEREEPALKVMHAYVDAMDFTGLDFDAAIRCGLFQISSSSTQHLAIGMQQSCCVDWLPRPNLTQNPKRTIAKAGVEPAC